MRTRRWAALGAAIVLSTSLFVAGGVARKGDPAEASATSPGSKDVIVHLFEWPWASIAKECTTVLGPKGFGAVQVSPPQEHVVLPGSGYPWWQDYQPVSYQLVTRRGDRAAFASMVSTCHSAGVKIIVDAVINHMAGGASTGTGSAGSTYSHYAYPSVPYGNDDFHHCGRNGNDDIVNYNDTWEVQNCELVDLSDLKTESSYVRGKIDGYLNDLISLGVDGFRVDAAKHMPAADLQAIYSGLNGSPYIFQEVIEGSGGPEPEDYTGIGDVTEFRYENVVGSAFNNGSLSGLNGLASQMRLGSGDAVAFIDNHDTQRNGAAVLTYKSGQSYALAEAFMLAFPYGTPSVMSSFAFSSSDQGPPSASNGTTSPVDCGTGAWVCEHRWRTTENMVGLRNAAAGAAVTNWWTNGSNQIAFGRGSNAYVAFNRSGSALTQTFQTSLAAGNYCDVMSGDYSAGACTGTVYTVNASGQVTLTVAANGVVGLDVAAKTTTGGGGGGTTCTTAAISFAENATTTFGQNIYVVGNTAALGNWDPAKAVALSSASYPVWTGSATLPAGTAVEYKYIKKQDSTVIWESDPNRTRTTPSSSPCSATWTDSWR